MGNNYRLENVGNSELLNGLSELVQESNVLTGRMLAHLVELEQRMLHLELGYSSLFSYCVEALRMSEGTAGRRVTAARVCRRFPEVFEQIARGDLHLCALCALAPQLTRENAAELFEACRGKTRRQIEHLLAARFPKPDVRAQIRRLPASRPAPAPAAAIEPVLPPRKSVDQEPESSVKTGTMPERLPLPAWQPAVNQGAPEHRSPEHRPPEHRPPEHRPPEVRRRRELEPLSSDRFGVHFTADAELRDLLERARELASHRLPKRDLGSLIKLLATSFVQREEKRRFGIGIKLRNTRSTRNEPKALPRPPCGAPPGGVTPPVEANQAIKRQTSSVRPDTRGRYLPVAVRRAAYVREGGQCAFVSPDGRRCPARGLIEFDHVKPFAKRGSADPQNIRLLCRSHNLLHARRCFGSLHISAKIAARRRSESTTRARGTPLR